MKRGTFTLLILVSSFLPVKAQLKHGEFALGGKQTDCANTIVETINREYLLYGTETSFTYSAMPYIAKLDTAGNVVWAEYAEEQGTIGSGMILIPTPQQQYVVVGGTDYNGLCLSSQNIFVDCLDLSGNIKWSYDIGYTYGAAQLFSLIQSKDSNIIYIGGDGYSAGGSPNPPVEGWYLNGPWGGVDIGKLSITGSLLWGGYIIDTINSGYYEPYGTSAVALNDGGYLITGGFDSIRQSILFLRFDSTRKIAFAKSISILNHINSTGNSIIQTKDKGYAIIGTTQDTVSDSYDHIFIIKFDSVYNVKWAKLIAGTGNDSAFSVVQTTSNGYAIAGKTSSFGAGGDDMYLAKLDSVGNLLWDKTIGGTYEDGGYSLINTDDYGYAIGGYTNSFGLSHNGNFYFVKLDSNGNSCNAKKAGAKVSNISVGFKPLSLYYKPTALLCSPHKYHDSGTETIICKANLVSEVKKHANSISIYPNPNDGKFTIQFSGDRIQNSVVEIYNMLGENIYSAPFNTQNSTLSISQPAGVYLYRIISEQGEQIATGKFVIN